MYMKHPIPFVDSEIPCLDFLLDKIRTDKDLPPWRRASVSSSIRLAAKLTGLVPGEIPANRSFLGKLFKELSLGAAGVSKKRLQNALSDLRFILKRYGLGGGTFLAPLTGTYKQLADNLTDKYHKIPLVKFLRYLQFHKIPPDQITDANSQGYLLDDHREVGLPRSCAGSHGARGPLPRPAHGTSKRIPGLEPSLRRDCGLAARGSSRRPSAGCSSASRIPTS